MTPAARLSRRGFVASAVAALGALAVPRARLAGAAASPATAGPAAPALIEDLVAANRILADQGVLDGYGHVSARHDRDPDRYLLSRSRAPELVTADDLMEYDLDSDPVDPRGRSMYLERFIHGEIYRARPEVGAVVHHHSPAVIPFGASTVPLRAIYHMAAFLGDGVPVFDIREEAPGMTDMLVSTPALGRSLARVLGAGGAVLMRGHGAVVVGATLIEAVARSVYMQVNARLQADAIALGGEVRYLAPEEARLARRSVERTFGRPWELWKRKAMSSSGGGRRPPPEPPPKQ